MLPEVHTKSGEVPEKDNDKYKLFTTLWYKIHLSLKRGNSYLLMKGSILHFCKSAVKDDNFHSSVRRHVGLWNENLKNLKINCKKKNKEVGRVLDWTFLILCLKEEGIIINVIARPPFIAQWLSKEMITRCSAINSFKSAWKLGCWKMLATNKNNKSMIHPFELLFGFRHLHGHGHQLQPRKWRTQREGSAEMGGRRQ